MSASVLGSTRPQGDVNAASIAADGPSAPVMCGYSSVGLALLSIERALS